MEGEKIKVREERAIRCDVQVRFCFYFGNFSRKRDIEREESHFAITQNRSYTQEREGKMREAIHHTQRTFEQNDDGFECALSNCGKLGFSIVQ